MKITLTIDEQSQTAIIPDNIGFDNSALAAFGIPEVAGFNGPVITPILATLLTKLEVHIKSVEQVDVETS